MLNENHIKEVLSTPVVIGSVANRGFVKRFSFNAWENEYIVEVNGVRVAAGQAVEELLDIYNSY